MKSLTLALALTPTQTLNLTMNLILWRTTTSPKETANEEGKSTKKKKEKKSKKTKSEAPESPESPKARPTFTAHIRWGDLTQIDAQRIVRAFTERQLTMIEAEPKELLNKELTGFGHWWAPPRFKCTYVAYKISEETVETLLELLVELNEFKEGLDEYLIHRSVWDT